MQTSDIGIIGLSVMGANLARNFRQHGYIVSVYNRTPEKTNLFMSLYAEEGYTACTTLSEFVASLKPPARIFMMVQAGAPVDDLLMQLLPMIPPGTILIDGGNSYFKDTTRRVKQVESAGSFFIGTGVSGGEEGALHGPSLMPGGSVAAWPAVSPLFQTIAAKSPNEDVPCAAWIGPDGAGHFVKMVHNGIEYADMQLIAESYGYMRSYLGMTPDSCAEAFSEWNTTELSSHLIQITADICRKPDDQDHGVLLDRVSDRVSQKGTGIWTSQVSLELGVPVPTITEAVAVRTLSEHAPHENHPNTAMSHTPTSEEKTTYLTRLKTSLYLSKIASYSQGFALIRKASETYGWNIHMADLSRIWQAGCIIRARLLPTITTALQTYPQTEHLITNPLFTPIISEGISQWRTLVSNAILAGVPLPAMTSALMYSDSLAPIYRSSHLIALQRDYFGSHGYRRTDKEGVFHTDWS